MVGAGYVGLVAAAGLAELGHHVACLEVDRERLLTLQAGRTPLHEAGLDRLLRRHRVGGRLRFTGDAADALGRAACVFVAVQTPAAEGGAADTRHVLAAVEMAARHAPRGAVLAVKSTVPVGCGDWLAACLAEWNRTDLAVVSTPEFLRQGSAVADFLHPHRVVIGSDDAAAVAVVRTVFAALEAPTVVCSRRSAEMAKYAANAFLAMRVSFINEVASLCEVFGADVDEVAHIAGADPRIGPAYLEAGLGWGGSCFPKDLAAIAAMARERGLACDLVAATMAVNDRLRAQIAERLWREVRDDEEPTVAVLGLTFKAGTDDLRESPALAVAAKLVDRGVHVRAHDPVSGSMAAALSPALRICASPLSAATGARALLVATAWPEYRALDWQAMARAMAGTLVLDPRRCLDGDAVVVAGLHYLSEGRKSPVNRRSARARRRPVPQSPVTAAQAAG